MAASTSSVLSAEWRRGLKDLQNAVLNPWNGITQTHEELGTIANPTQFQVTSETRGHESFESVLNNYAARNTPAKEPVREQQSER